MQLLLVSLCPGPAGSYPKFGYGCRRVVALLILSSKGIIHSRGVPVTPSFLRPTGSYPKFGLVVVALLISSFLTRSYLARDASVFCSRTPRTRSWASVVAVAHAMSTPEYSITFQHSLQRIKVLQHFAGDHSTSTLHGLHLFIMNWILSSFSSPFLFQIQKRGRGPHLDNLISFLSDRQIVSLSASSASAIAHHSPPYHRAMSREPPFPLRDIVQEWGEERVSNKLG